jgi:hypothetical protein
MGSAACGLAVGAFKALHDRDFCEGPEIVARGPSKALAVASTNRRRSF